MKSSKSLKKIIMLFILIFLVVICSVEYINGTIVETTGYSEIVSKTSDNNGCYIYVQNNNKSIKLKCTNQEYNDVVIDENLGYGMSYKWSTRFPSKNKLIYLNFEDVIDNR